MARFLNPTVNTGVLGTVGSVSATRASPAGLMLEIRPGCPNSPIADHPCDSGRRWMHRWAFMGQGEGRVTHRKTIKGHLFCACVFLLLRFRKAGSGHAFQVQRVGCGCRHVGSLCCRDGWLAGAAWAASESTHNDANTGGKCWRNVMSNKLV